VSPAAWDAHLVKPDEYAGPPGRRVPQQVRIVHLTAPVFRSLHSGDLAAANTVSPVPLSDSLAGPECAAVWHRRSKQVEEDPASAAWVTGVIWDERRQVAVGRAGYHGPPDLSGMVEIGYAVDPRRTGGAATRGPRWRLCSTGPLRNRRSARCG
jgi:hypothetical protein